MRAAFSNLGNRLSILAIGLAGAVALASSCSLDAAVTTDDGGRIVAVTSVRIESTVRDLGVAMLVRSRELVLEFKWQRGLARALLVERI